MFYHIAAYIVRPEAVEFIERRNERFVLNFPGSDTLAVPAVHAGEVNQMAKGFIKAHNGDLVNLAHLRYASKVGDSYILYLPNSTHTIIDEEEIGKIETILNRRKK